MRVCHIWLGFDSGRRGTGSICSSLCRVGRFDKLELIVDNCHLKIIIFSFHVLIKYLIGDFAEKARLVSEVVLD